MEVLPSWLNDYLGDLRWGLLSPQQARIPEGEEPATLRVGFHVADDDVIQQFDLKSFGCFAQRACDMDIR